MIGLLIGALVLGWVTALAVWRHSTGVLILCGWFWLVGLACVYEDWRGRDGPFWRRR